MGDLPALLSDGSHGTYSMNEDQSDQFDHSTEFSTE